MRVLKNLVSGVVLCLFAAAFYWAIAASAKPVSAARGRAIDVMGDMGFPTALAFVIGLGGLVIIVGSLLALRERPATGRTADTLGAAGDQQPLELTRSLVLVVVVTGFVLLLPLLGYLLAMPLFLMVALVMSGYRAYGKALLFTVAFTAATYAGFVFGLGVRLPTVSLF